MYAVWGFLQFICFTYAKCASEEGTRYEQQGSLLCIRQIRQEMQRQGDVMVTWTTQSEVLTCICPTSYLRFITCSVLLSHHKQTAPGFTWKQTKTWVFKWTNTRVQNSFHTAPNVHKCDCTLSWQLAVTSLWYCIFLSCKYFLPVKFSFLSAASLMSTAAYWGMTAVTTPLMPCEPPPPPLPAQPPQPPLPPSQPPCEPPTAKAPTTDKTKKAKKDKVSNGAKWSALNHI